jgi:hypothetical protein
VGAAGLYVSANFPTTRSGSGGSGSPRGKRARTTTRKAATGGTRQPAGGLDETSRTSSSPRGSEFSTEVQIEAGRVVLTVDVNPIELRGEDRDFFGLVDTIRDYANRTGTASTTNGAAVDNEDGERS